MLDRAMLCKVLHVGNASGRRCVGWLVVYKSNASELILGGTKLKIWIMECPNYSIRWPQIPRPLMVVPCFGGSPRYLLWALVAAIVVGTPGLLRWKQGLAHCHGETCPPPITITVRTFV
jgi:hypothetical protein